MIDVLIFFISPDQHINTSIIFPSSCKMKLTIAMFAALAGLANSEITYTYHEGLVASATASIDVEGTDTDMAAYQMSTPIAAPNSKDLILMLSSEIGILTDTTVRDSNKVRRLPPSTAAAEAGVVVHMKYCKESECPSTAMGVCETADGVGGVYEALPKGGITFAARSQELSVDVNLDCECEVPDTTCECEVTGFVEVGLNIETTAAHTFNFIADLSNTGTGSTNDPIVPYACFELSAEASVMLDDNLDSSGSATGFVGLQSSMLIIQEASTSNLL